MDAPFSSGGSFSLSLFSDTVSMPRVPDLLRGAGAAWPFVCSLEIGTGLDAAALLPFSPLFFKTVQASEDSLTGVVAALSGCTIGKPKTSEGDLFREGVPPGLDIMLRSIQGNPLADING